MYGVFFFLVRDWSKPIDGAQMWSDTSPRYVVDEKVVVGWDSDCKKEAQVTRREKTR